MLAWTEQLKCRGLSEQPNDASDGNTVMQHKTPYWNNLDKFELQQQYRLGTFSNKYWVGAETQICYVFETLKTICHLDC